MQFFSIRITFEFKDANLMQVHTIISDLYTSNIKKMMIIICLFVIIIISEKKY